MKMNKIKMQQHKLDLPLGSEIPADTGGFISLLDKTEDFTSNGSERFHYTDYGLKYSLQYQIRTLGGFFMILRRIKDILHLIEKIRFNIK